VDLQPHLCGGANGVRRARREPRARRAPIRYSKFLDHFTINVGWCLVIGVAVDSAPHRHTVKVAQASNLSLINCQNQTQPLVIK